MMLGKGTMRSLRRPASQGCWLTMTGREGSQGRDSFDKIRVTAELSLLWRDDGQAAMPLAVRVTPSEFVSGDKILRQFHWHLDYPLLGLHVGNHRHHRHASQHGYPCPATPATPGHSRGQRPGLPPERHHLE